MLRYALVAFLLAVAPVGATDFFIDPVTGSDSGTGSASNPWRTLEAVIAANRIETRSWASLPYQPGMGLVTVNPGAPVKAGDTLWLRSGYHGAVVIQRAYNAAPITVAAQTGHVPRMRSLLVQSAQNWVFRGLSVSPSHAPPLSQITMVDIRDHNWSGPAWDIEIHDSDVFTVADPSAWSASDWVNLASSGVSVGADRVTVRSCRVRNVRFGISVGGDDARIQENLVDSFSADGLRGLGNNGLFEYNRIQNNLIGGPDDANHDDGFQSWSVGPGGVGTGAVSGVVLRGNIFINHVDPNNPLRSTMQGIGCFDGLFDGWVVENNVVVTDHWHGISFYGMRNSRIVNNTVIDLNQSSPGPPWIMVTAHKDGRPSESVIVRNNLSTDFSLAGNNVTGDHNLEITDAAALFVAPPYDLHLRSGTAAVDAGNAALAPPVDVERVARPQGAGFDLGAYESLGTTVSIRGGAVSEGNAGGATVTFTVTLSSSAPTPATSSVGGSGPASSANPAMTGAPMTVVPPGTAAQTAIDNVVDGYGDENEEPRRVGPNH